MILDFIELSSDEEGDNEREERYVHGLDPSVQVKGEVIDLTTECNFEAPHDVYGRGDTAQNKMSQSLGFNAKEGEGEVPQCKQEFVGDNGQGGVAHCATATQSLDSVGDDGQGSAAHCSPPPPARQGSTADGQSDASDCTTASQRLESVSDGQGDIARCTPPPQRLESPASLGQGSAAQCTNTSHIQVLVTAVDSIQEAMLSGSAAEATTSLTRTQEQRNRTTSLLNLPPGYTAPLFPRQFWKAGEYSLAAQTPIVGGQNRLRVHPKFLHSNATSHKWAFGAVAELLDNAVDEIHNGATFVKIDKIKHVPDGEYSLMIQDDGGGMSPESLRRCMSFGFSHKCSTSSIGQYGNGFKTSTMRLGADVIVFTCKQDIHNRILTQSVGLLSYTFLMRTRCNDILVPVVDYEFDASSSTFKRIMNCGEKHFLSNLSALLKWSPFSTEEELLNQFRGMEFHGTKIIVFNLWLNDEQEMELDFITDEEDIMISGAKRAGHGTGNSLKQMHVASRFRYSLRVYSSILYLHLPQSFRIILCGRVVEPHHIANDLIYPECIKYRPQVNEITEVDVITTIGFLKGAPKLDIYGFNVYHKNRLILPFWPAGSFKYNRRGIAGVLETNFIRPTHDKQDFEKTGLFHRLETRLKDMAMEYWTYHCDLIGYAPIAKRSAPSYYVSIATENHDNLASQATTNIYTYNSRGGASVQLHPCSSGDNLQDPLQAGAWNEQRDCDACPSTSINVGTSPHLPRTEPQQSQTELCKQRNSSGIYWRAQKRQKNYASHPGSVEVAEELSRAIVAENTRLKTECFELEATVDQLTLKADELSIELDYWKGVCKGYTDQLQSCDRIEALLRKDHYYHSNPGYYRPCS